MSDTTEGSYSKSKKTNCFDSMSKLQFFLIILVLCIITILIVVLVVILTPSKKSDDNEIRLTSILPPGTNPQGTTPPATMPPGTTPPAETTTPEDRTKPWNNVRLPTNIKPSWYNLSLFPHFYDDEGNHYFEGNVNILIAINESTKIILIHKGADINITETQVLGTGSKILPINSTFYYANNEFWVITMSNTLEPGIYNVKLTFTSPFANDLAAFYKSSYVDPTANKTRTIVSSDFEPTDARRAFPCFDEPSMKAEFAISLIHRENYTALSNMPIENTAVYKNDSQGPVYFNTKFQKTVKMSTYIVCFVICQYDYVSNTSQSGIPVRVYVPPHKINETEYGLKVGMKSLDYFVDYFNLNYTLPKLDLIMIPNFKAGAMENWGLITFREIALLYAGRESDFIDTRLYPGGVVAHELAHMWFGNLVTMAWWDDLWLNEGFASFAAEKALSYAENNVSMAIRQIGNMRNVMNLDNNIWSHPIRVPVNRPEEIRAIFDSITYLKGGAVILMLESILGEEDFKKGLRAYMREFDSDNAVTTDLWRSLGNAKPSINVTTLMDTWTLQMGYPLVTIGLTNGKFIAKQEWYLLNQSNAHNAEKSPMNYKWEIHLQHNAYTNTPTENPVSSTTELTTSDTSKELNTQGTVDFVVANFDSTGYYRVNYEESLWDKIKEALKVNRLSETEKVTLIDDAFNIAKINRMNYSQVLQMIDFAKNENSSVVWTFIARNFAYLEFMLQDSDVQGNWKRFLVGMTAALYGQSTPDQRLKRTITDLACGAAYQPCLNDMGQQLINWMNRNLTTPYSDPFWEGTILRHGLHRFDTEENWKYLWQKYTDPSDTTDKNSIIRALSSTSNQWLVKRLYGYAQDPKLIKEQDKYRSLTLISEGSSYGNLLVLDWLNEKASPLREGSREENLARSVFAYYKTEWELQKANDTLYRIVDPDIRNKFTTHRFPNYVFDRIKFNIQWNNNIGKNLREWLVQY